MKAPFYERDRGYCGDRSRGASLGRPSDPVSLFEGKRTRLQRVPLDSGGYDPGGAYWGFPCDLYCAWTRFQGDVMRDPTIVAYFRAPDRESAKAEIPGARFYR